MKNVINWFEIVVEDLERAIGFYESVMAVTLRRENMPDFAMAIFPHDSALPGGALVKCTQMKPSAQGVVIYLHTDDIVATLERVRENGGECAFGPQILPNDIGTIALFTDSEGNRIGLHQPA